MAVRINIVRRKVAGGDDIVVFEPSPLQVPTNERVFWCNLDPLQEHHIDRVPKPLKRYTGEPPDMTPIILVQESIDYSCRLHGEKGTITVPGTT
jgi:hypothetical protein